MGTSLLHRISTPELTRTLETRATPAGWTFDDLTRCGRRYPDCKIGVHAGDAASYEVFAPLLDPIIAAVHGVTTGAPGRWTQATPDLDGSLREDLAVLSASVRVTRNLTGNLFCARMGRRGRLEVERRTVAALRGLSRRFPGSYHPLADLPRPRRRTLEVKGLCFLDDDRYLVAAGITRDWPEARGLWSSDDRRLVVWINEEDHLRVIATSQNGDLGECLVRARELAWALEDLLGFHYDARLGYLASCPSNVGTGMRASATVRLPRLIDGRADLHATAEELGLECRGVQGKTVVLSNRRLLGASEVESIERLAAGLHAILELERRH